MVYNIVVEYDHEAGVWVVSDKHMNVIGVGDSPHNAHLDWMYCANEEYQDLKKYRKELGMFLLRKLERLEEYFD